MSRRFRRLERLAGLLTIALSLGVILFGWMAPSVNLPFLQMRFDSSIIMGVGAIVGFVGIFNALRPSPASAGLFLLFLCASLSILAFARAPRRGDMEINPSMIASKMTSRSDSPTYDKVWTSETDWFEPYVEPHPRYGSLGMPNRQARQHHRDFDVSYTHGPDGFRVMPEPADLNAPTIAFIGCSMTYGIGVPDDGTFAYLLARNVWPNYRVENLSCSGWGTNHAAVVAEDLLARPQKPIAIVYVFIADHLRRNYLRKSWHSRLNAGAFPFFDLEGQYKGLVGIEKATREDGPELDEEERRVTRALLDRMNRRCQKHGVPLLVVFLQDNQRGPSLRSVLDMPELTVLDATGAMDETFPRDGHATGMSHQRVARFLANNRTLAERTGRDDLYNPSAFPALFPGEDFIRLESNEDSKAVLEIINARSAHLRVEKIHSPHADANSVRLVKRISAWTGDELVTLTCEARAERPRKLEIGVRQGAALRSDDPWLPAAKLGKEWRTITGQFATKTIQDPVLCIGFGDGDAAFEIR